MPYFLIDALNLRFKNVQQPEDQNRMLNETFDLGRKRSQSSNTENSRRY